jgi:hypothetical protein
MFYDDEPVALPWDYFLTDYERDLLTLTLEDMVRRNPEKTEAEISADFERLTVGQSILHRQNRIISPT